MCVCVRRGVCGRNVIYYKVLTALVPLLNLSHSLPSCSAYILRPKFSINTQDY